jgi:CRISPR-associated endonuclease/helicase Cas3
MNARQGDLPMHTLYLGAVDSRDASDEEIASAQIDPKVLPSGFRLRAHQARTIAALKFGTEPVVINSAMTGDGKSFIAQYLALEEKYRTMVFYPTNELAKDQKRAVEALKRRWDRPNPQRARVGLISAAEIDQIAHDLAEGRSNTLEQMLVQNDMVLTNPDIFHLIMQFRYRVGGAANDRLPTFVADKFSLFTFDEFHIFGAPEYCSALIAMQLIQTLRGEQRQPVRFLYLSATPPESFTRLLNSIGLSCTAIEGRYVTNATTVHDGCSRIMQPITLHLIERGDGIEAWLDANLDRIIAFFQQHPNARAAIIVNAIGTAWRIHVRIARRLRAAGIAVPEPNTGLTPPDARLVDAPLIIATSTVDVGVDFRINLLIFESMDGATHLQRLGRLGRHEKDNANAPFGVFEAYAILPAWVVDSLQRAFPESDQVIDRTAYRREVEKAYPRLQGFELYRARWGSLQAGHVLINLEAKEIRVQYKETRARLNDRLEKPFPKARMKFVRASEQSEHKLIPREAISFRGSTPFTALVKNMLSQHETIQSYNLVTLLRSGELEAMTLQSAYHQAGERRAILEKSEPLVACRLTGWLDRPRDLRILLDRDTRDWGDEKFERVIEQRGLWLDVTPDSVPELHALRRVMEKRYWVVLFVRGFKPDELRFRYRLGMQLELFPFQDVNGLVSGTAAFGRDALLLDSIIYRDPGIAQKAENDQPFFS